MEILGDWLAVTVSNDWGMLDNLYLIERVLHIKKAWIKTVRNSDYVCVMTLEQI